MIVTFGNPDEVRATERQLLGLKQRGSAGMYAAEFKRISSKLDWGDQALQVQFYRGLRDDVKDELSKEPRPDDFHLYVERAILIDNRLYERRLERAGPRFEKPNTGRPRPNTGNRRWHKSIATGHHAGPMDLDATGHDKK